MEKEKEEKVEEGEEEREWEEIRGGGGLPSPRLPRLDFVCPLFLPFFQIAFFHFILFLFLCRQFLPPFLL